MKNRLKQLISYSVWPILAFTISLLLSISVYIILKEKASQGNEKQFSTMANQARERLIRRLDQSILLLQASKSLISTAKEVSYQEWKSYITGFDIYKNYPGIQGLGFAQVILPQQLEAHIQRMRSQGLPQYTVWPAGKRNLYTSIIYLEPLNNRNSRAIGYDMFSEPTRRRAMEKARDTGKPVITGKMRLIQESDANAQPGFLIYLPVYDKGILPASVPGRRHYLKGYVYAPFRAYNLMSSVFPADYADINIQIYDSRTTNPAHLLYDKKQLHKNTAATDTEKPKYEAITYIQVGDRTWTMRVSSLPIFEQSGGLLPNLVLIAGFIISTLAGLAMWSFINSRRSNLVKQIITDNTTGAVFMTDIRGYCTFMNPAAEKMTGFTFEEIRQKPLHYMIHHHRPDGTEYPLAECQIHKTRPIKESLRGYEDVFIRKNGAYFPVSCAVSPIFENGILVSNVLEVRDITEERKAQAGLQESEARFRNMADSAPVLIWMNDAQGFITYLNRQWYEFTHFTEAESLGKGWKKALHPDDIAKVKAIYNDGLSREVSFSIDYRIQRFDGVYRWMAANASPRFDAQGEFRGYIGSITDITERKEAEKRLMENAELLNQIFVQVPAIVAIIRASDQVYIQANPIFRKLHGNRPLIGHNIREANPDLERQGFFRQIEKVIATGKPFIRKEVPVTFENADKPYMGYFNLIFQPLYTDQNQLDAILLFSVEVTELVVSRTQLQETNLELSRTNEELRRTNIDLDNFVYTASHDLKSPIANLEGLTNDLQYTLQGRIKADEKFLLELLSGSINKLKRTIQDLSDISKVQKEVNEDVEPLQFAEVINDVLADIQNRVNKSGAQIILDLDVPQIKYIRKNLRSILYNLISNAIKYQSPDREPVIKIGTSALDNYICLTIADNGLGIRTDQHHKLFGMFKRVHTHVEGSGIGLYIVKRIVENYGGKIEMESTENVGTTFRIYFEKQCLS
ncbi:MAG: histidine kinase [Cytophagales bacterium CG18_big_fil_WC_8_21_14_2_50_42_9]|nr:MAG: histidine kinase [Cytophagales bacterium CG18_big_fil_WC_8_21_14_2_50_42_9]